MASRPEPWPAPPPAPATHPIYDRVPLGSPEARTAALCYIAASLCLRRIKDLCASFEKGEMVMQMSLASASEADRELIGKMSGHMGQAALDLLNVGPEGPRPRQGGQVE